MHSHNNHISLRMTTFTSLFPLLYCQLSRSVGAGQKLAEQMDEKTNVPIIHVLGNRRPFGKEGSRGTWSTLFLLPPK